MEKSICVFGDSTAWGAWDKEKGGWVNRLWLYLAQVNSETELYNLSISGGTSETILQRFENEAKIREADILIFQTGGNDAAYEKTEDNYLVSPDKFRRNIQEIIEKAKKISDIIVFIGFKNVDESKTKPVPWREVYYTNDNIKNYNHVMKEICEKNNIFFLEIYALLENDDLDDGLHPNDIGHQKIFEKVKDLLLSKVKL